jgi:hypothetical protein
MMPRESIMTPDPEVERSDPSCAMQMMFTMDFESVASWSEEALGVDGEDVAAGTIGVGVGLGTGFGTGTAFGDAGCVLIGAGLVASAAFVELAVWTVGKSASSVVVEREKVGNVVVACLTWSAGRCASAALG